MDMIKGIEDVDGKIFITNQAGERIEVVAGDKVYGSSLRVEEKVRRIPYIGAVVLYMRYGTPGGEHKPEPSPAIIVKVLDVQDKCSLFVVNPNGLYFNETPYSEELKPGHWSWAKDGHGNAIKY